MSLDDAINRFVEEQMFPIFGIAIAEGFAHALPRWHPKELIPNCESEERES